jgi:phosphoserine phosphatase
MSIQLFFLDMEGTLYAKQHIQHRAGEPHYHHSLWARLMYELGPGALAEDAQTILKWEAGLYTSYIAWCDESVRILQKHGLTRQRFEDIVTTIAYNPGVKETIQALHQRHIKTAIISGGFMTQARQAQMELKITHAYAAIDLLWETSGQLVHWNILPSDYAGKVDFVKLLRREYGLSRDACGFVGDGKNDVLIAQEVGTSFAYQAHPELRVAASHAIEDFAEILRYLSPS